MAAIPADYLIQGDGEHALNHLKKIINGPIETIPGVWTRTQDAVRSGPPPEPITDLDALPFPARHLVRSYHYGQAYDPRLKPREFTSIITSRGCPFACRFCSRPSLGAHRYRTRSIPNIIQEFREIASAGYRTIAIMDDCFPPPKERAHALFDALLKEHLDLRLYVTAARVDFADAALYAKMKQAGVVSVQFGCESGCQATLDYYGKRTTIDQIREAVRLSQNAGFITIGSFIFGAPGETRQQMNQTARFARSLPFDSVSFLPLRYMAGSELWARARDEGKIAADEYIVLADDARGLSEYPVAELMRICHSAQWSFYLRPRYALGMLARVLRRNDASFLRSFLASPRG